ncbi:putative E3 ubiquitin-protein ligase XBAT35 [Sesamum angolense]|uniref:E3 ubiquitin-protein ligase XBAT35 n=1 Tax=Sesamum angolense TaxID=2727404 RepID=A0AAE1VV05_9LAMI|nr:putative E3 ubiquitin-protein ligase XBAT35 [Sesamum angolense]
MGQQQSKDELLYQQVNYGNVEGIKALRSQGAGLEDNTSTGFELLHEYRSFTIVQKLRMIELVPFNINLFMRGTQPLSYDDLLSEISRWSQQFPANPLVMNDDLSNPLDARAKGYGNVVRTIEGHICLFSGWLRELYGPGFLELLAPQLLSRKVLGGYLPCGSRNLRKPLKLELAIYSGLQDSQPRTTIPLWKANLEEPNFNQPDPAAVISDFSKSTRIKLAPVHENEKNQLQRFCNACKGIPQVTHPLFPFNNQVPTAPAPNSEDEELAMAINASLQSAAHQRPPHTDTYIGSGTDASTSTANSMNNTSHQENYTTGTASTSHETSGSKCEVQEAGSTSSPAEDSEIYNHVLPVIQPTLEDPSLASMPSAPPAVDAANYDGPILYPPIDMSPVDLSSQNVGAESSRVDEKNKDSVTSSCTICLDAPVEGACIPCGHMAGCMSCLNEIKAKKWGCPVCRAKIDQVIVAMLAPRAKGHLRQSIRSSAELEKNSSNRTCEVNSRASIYLVMYISEHNSTSKVS